MNTNTLVRQRWIEQLHNRGLSKFAATMLEAAGPLNLIAAQFIYMAQPVLRGILPTKDLNALANMLEDSGETGLFVEQLRE
ncbi:MAG: hypothetical protein IH859_00565 [Chloroflexi bacterium]|nr:hypothetical protein [Chloroflexota bacterium]